MPVIEEDWGPLARSLGYPDARDMLTDMYVNQEQSLGKMSKALGFSTFAVRRRLINYRIPLRAKGGPNNVSKILQALTDEELFTDSQKELAVQLGVNPTSIYNERKRRKQEWSSASSAQSTSSSDTERSPSDTSCLPSTSSSQATSNSIEQEPLQETPSSLTTESMKESTEVQKSSSEQ